MGMTQVSSCCCGCSLRFGTFVVGFIFSIVCLSQTITLSVMANNMGCRHCPYDEYYGYDRGAVIAQAVVSALLLLTNILLFVGALKDNAKLIKPWLIIYTIIFAIEFVYGIYLVVVFFTYSAAEGFYALLTLIFIFSFIYYFLVVVKSYYKSLVSPVLPHHPQFVGQVYAAGMVVQQPQQMNYNPHMGGQGYPQGQVHQQSHLSGYPPMQWNQQGQGYPQGYPQMQPQTQYPPVYGNLQQSPPPKY